MLSKKGKKEPTENILAAIPPIKFLRNKNNKYSASDQYQDLNRWIEE
ncbi:hypothetical Protein YC6258_00541 [Gynuella sunshinyii YC6258]|uniref:Uncharacterized protein n=1 Tax=Gynuella sunshinyii YC6258 TaxID=1445510 RepID=A0A0C5VEE6_9GAMM|nr:hypothetical Protein YC6258_00541 [Gynuella sunshinyii YC6258]